jgi:GWxTD domain-containing protein
MFPDLSLLMILPPQGRSFGLLVFIWIVSALPSSAQWELGVAARLGGSGNTQVLLGYTAPTDAPKEFAADISFRLAGQHRTYLRKEVYLQTRGSRIFSVFFTLPEGDYEVDVDLHDRSLGAHSLLSLPGIYRVKPRRSVSLSDILLSRERSPEAAFDRPVLTPFLQASDRSLHYFVEIEAAGYRNLVLRAILYRERETSQADQENASAYVSVQQSTRILNLGGRSLFQDSLNIGQLSAGEYMIQTLVYDEEELLGEEKTWFRVGGDIQARIFADLPLAIRMMQYACPPQRLEELLRIEDPLVQQSEFLKTWEVLYPLESSVHMERYYQKIFEADRRFAEGGMPGWQTDRGRIFIQYGEPRERALELNGKPCLRWTYSRWELSFLFVAEGSRYRLANP